MKAGRAIVALAACTGLWTAAPTGARAAVVEEIAATVNGKIITRSALLTRENTVMSQLSSRFVGDELDREVEQARKSLLNDMIREEILLQRAEVLGLELDKVYQQALTQLKEQQGIKTQEELDTILRQEGISADEMKDTLLRFNVPDIMVNLEVREKISVTDQEVAEVFAKNPEKYRVEESFSIQEIVLTQDERTAQELKDLTSKVMEELRGGTPFNELVVKYSQAPSRFNDGKIGPLKRGELSSDLEAAAFALKPGDISEPLSTRAGVHIIRLESHTLPKEPTLEDARPKIVAELKQQKFTEALEKYFKMLMETNRITINPNYKQYAQDS